MSNRLAGALTVTALCVLALACVSSGAWGMTKGSPPGPRIQSTVELDANNWEIYIDNLGRHTTPLPGAKPGGYWPKGSGRNYIYGGGIWVGVLNHTSKPDTQVTWGYNPNSGQAEFCPMTPDGDPSKYLDPTAKVYLSTNPNDVLAWPVKYPDGKNKILSLQDSWTKFGDVNPTYLVAPDLPIGVEVTRTTYAWPYPGYADIVYFLFSVKNVTALTSGGARTLTDVILGNNMDCDIGNESLTNANDLDTLDNTAYQVHRKIGGRDTTITITRNLAVQYQLANEPGWSINAPYYVGFRFFQGPINNTGQTIQIRSQPGIGYPNFDRDVLPGEPLGMTAFQIFTITVDPSTAWDRYMELAGYYYKTPTIYNAYQLDTFGPSDKRFLQCSGPFTLAPDSSAPLVVGVMGGLNYDQVVKNSDKAQDIFDSGFLAPYPPVAPNLTAVPGDHKVSLYWDHLPEVTPDPYYSQISDTALKKQYRAYDLAGYKVYKARNVADLSDPTKRKLIGWFDKLDGFTIVKDAQPKIVTLPNGQQETLQVWDTLGTDNGLQYSLVDSGQFLNADSMGITNGLPYFYGVTGYDYQWYSAWHDSIVKIDSLHSDTFRVRRDTFPGNPTTLEGSASEKYVIAVPRTPQQDQSLAHINPANWVFHGGAYQTGLHYSPRVANPDTVTKYPSTYQYQWLPVSKGVGVDWLSIGWWNPFYLPQYSLLVKDVTNNQYAMAQKVVPGTDTTLQGQQLVTVVDTVSLGIDTTQGEAGTLYYKPGKSIMLKGIEFGLLDTVKWTNFKSGTVTVLTGNYDPSLPLGDTTVHNTPSPFAGFQPQFWAFRGSLFRITWHVKRHTVKGDSIWADVRDSTNQVDVPPETLAVSDSAKLSGWCFGGSHKAFEFTNQRGKLWIDSTMVSITGTGDTFTTIPRYPGSWLTLCGQRYWFAGKLGGYSGRPMLWRQGGIGGNCPINDGDVWLIQQKGFQVPCEGNWMQFAPVPNQVATGGKALLDAIKVVPNPYLVRNSWDVSKEDKHLMFTHLPTKCTIRIYTLAGNLVKIIYHDGTQNSFQTMGGTTPVGGTGGTEFWNLLTYNSQLIASGVYLYHVEAPGIGNKIGKFAVIQ